MNTSITAYPLGWQIFAYTLLGLGVVGCWGFLIRYTATYDWWRNEEGAHIAGFSGALGLFLTFYAVVAVWPSLPARGAIRIVLFVLLVSVIWWRWLLFERTRFHRRRAEKGGGS